MKVQLSHKQVIAQIEASPQGPGVGSFFDLDGTLIAGHTAKHMASDGMGDAGVGARDILRALLLLLREGLNESTFSELAEMGWGKLRDTREEDLTNMGQKLFEAKILDLIYPEMREIVKAHQRRGHTVVLSSSASSPQVEPVADHLGIRHVLCNRFVVKDGVLTGEVVRPIIWGAGKARAVQRFAIDRDIDLKLSYFYADGNEELATMNLVGHPRPTNPGKRLAKVAQKRGWPSLRFNSR